MNIPTLTEREYNSIYAINFVTQDDMTPEENDKYQIATATKIMTILIHNTDLTYPKKIQDEIDKKAQEIKDRELIVRLKDNGETTELTTK